MENQEQSNSPSKVSSSPTPEINPVPAKDYTKTALVFLSFIILILAAVIGALILSQQKDGYSKENKVDLSNNDEENSDVEDEVEVNVENIEEEKSELPTDEIEDPTDDEPETVIADEDRIVYVKEGNVWVMNSDGTGKIQITDDASSVIEYRAIDWKAPGIISYSKCGGECAVYTYDLDSASESLVFAGIPFTQSFDAIEWSHDANSLAYIFTKGDYSKEASLFSAGTTIILESYAEPPGRGGGYDDGMEIEFSPDDSKLIILNTIIDEAVNKPVIVSSVDGTILAQLEDATFPTFADNNSFYYKFEGDMKMWNLTTSTPSNVTTFPTGSVHNFRNSPDGYFVSFWSEISSANWSIGYYDTAGSSSTIALNYVDPKWLDSGSVYVVAIKVGGESIMGYYESGGLSRVKRTDGSTLVLDTGNITNFEVE